MSLSFPTYESIGGGPDQLPRHLHHHQRLGHPARGAPGRGRGVEALNIDN